MTRTVFANGRNFSHKGRRGVCRMSDVRCQMSRVFGFLYQSLVHFLY